MKHFDLNDWVLDEIVADIEQRISDSKKPIPPKVKKHGVNIFKQTGEGCYRGTYNEFYHHYPIETKERAEMILNACGWLEKIGDNMWVENDRSYDYYELKDGTHQPVHYFIKEFDYEEYEDGKDYIEYSNTEKQALIDTLDHIKLGIAYLRAYDRCSDDYGFGNNGYLEYLNKETKKYINK